MTETKRAAESEPLVSVVVPVYNAAATIHRALGSVRAQTYVGICEVIVVDDGSTDGTAEIVRSDFPDATLISQENQGSAVARNRGVEVASGEYIAFLDDDDEWLPEKTEVQMECFVKCQGLVMTLTDAVAMVDGVAQERPDAEAGPLVRPLTFAGVFPIVPFRYGCSGWMVERALFREGGGFLAHMRRSQDTELLWRALARGHSVARIGKPLYRYYSSFCRRSPEDRARTWRTWFECMAPIVEGYAERASQGLDLLTEHEAQESLARFYWYAAQNLWREGQRELGRQCFARSLSHSHAQGMRGRLRCRLAAWSPPAWNMVSRVLTWVGYE